MVGRPHKSILVLASNPATPSSRELETSPNSPPETTRFHPENHIDLVPMALKDVPEGQLHIPTFCQSTLPPHIHYRDQCNHGWRLQTN
ncbi:hypothetical protein BDL97_13G074100 [Sphagnum fallax]|nr:hypothetical protein BDL97_13G074100 [Sphagnum fallax]